MPVIMVPHDDLGEPPVQRYQSPFCGYLDYNIAGLVALRDRRRQYAVAEQELVTVQKTLRGDDARYLKAIVRSFQRQQRAVSRLLRWFETDIDLGFKNEWPLELASEFDREFAAYELACCPPMDKEG